MEGRVAAINELDDSRRASLVSTQGQWRKVTEFVTGAKDSKGPMREKKNNLTQLVPMSLSSTGVC